MAYQKVLSTSIDLLRRFGPLSAAQLAARSSISRPTLTRALGRARSEVVRIGGGRSSRYALLDSRYRDRTPIALHRIDADGSLEKVAELTVLEGGSVWVEPAVDERWITGGSDRGLFEDLPYYLVDQRPQGYLGRLQARGLPVSWPRDIHLWQSHHILEYLVSYGADSSGDLIVGDVVNREFDLSDEVQTSERGQRYQELAERVLAYGNAGSSAAGERPKFIVKLIDRNSTNVVHAIVKFSPPRNTPAGQRWSDLLYCEHIALDTLQAAGWPVAKTQVVVTQTRSFLESIRYDRVGRYGRSQVLSLDVIDGQFLGKQQSWSATARELLALGWLDAESADWIVKAEYFGELIANNDRHLGNISITFADDMFQICPLYDMLPMAFAPSNGEVVAAREWKIHGRKDDSAWTTAKQLAQQMWQRVLDEPDVSKEFKQDVAQRMLSQLT